MSSEGHELRKAFFAELRSVDGKNNLVQAWFVVLANIVSAVIAAAFSIAAFSYIGVYAAPIYIICIFFIGTRYRALANIIHECSHYGFTANREWNNIFGKILSIPLFASFDAYRESHYTHHQYLGDDEKDLDFKGLSDFGFTEMITQLMVIRHFLTTMTLRHVPLYIGRVFYVKTDAPVFNIMRTLYVVAILSVPVVFGFLSTQTLLLIAYGVVPYAITLQIITYWQDALDHAGVIKNDDELYQTRNSVLRNRLLRAILFPRNDCYHLVHHLFPHIPIANLPASHEVLMRDPRYAQLNHDIVERTRSFWRPQAKA